METVKSSEREFLTTEEKRQLVTEYLETNPGASDQEVAENVAADVSKNTVRKWRKEWESEAEDDTTDDEAGAFDSVKELVRDETPDSDPDQDAEPDLEEPENSQGEIVDHQPSPGLEPDPGDEVEPEPPGADHPGGSASERQLRRLLQRKNSRIEELESVVREFIQGVNNQDPEAIRATAESAEELVADG